MLCSSPGVEGTLEVGLASVLFTPDVKQGDGGHEDERHGKDGNRSTVKRREKVMARNKGIVHTCVDILNEKQ